MIYMYPPMEVEFKLTSPALGLKFPMESPGLWSSDIPIAHARPNTTRSNSELAPNLGLKIILAQLENTISLANSWIIYLYFMYLIDSDNNSHGI